MISHGRENKKLAMGEYWHLQIDTNVFEGLALRFVDRHGERKFDGKLVASENEGVVAVSHRRGKRDARNQSDITSRSPLDGNSVT